MEKLQSIANLRTLVLTHGIYLWRNKWIAVGACWLVCIVGWTSLTFLPRQYTSDARAYIDVNGLLTPLLRGLVVESNAAQTSEYLRQTLLSRPNLEQVVRLAELSAENAVERDALIAKLARDVRVTAQGRDNLVRISYTAPDPVVAKNVVEALLTIFAEQSASTNRVAMDSARKFLEQKIAEYEVQLRAAEQRRADFRKQYAAYLADSATGIPRVQGLQQQVTAARQAYEAAVVQRDALQAQLNAIPQYINVANAPAVGANGQIIPGSPAARLAQAQGALNDLRLRYTDLHPDVMAAKRVVDELQAQVNAPAAANAGAPAEGSARIPNPTYENVRLRLVDMQVTIPATRQRLEQATAELQRAQGIISEIPDIDAKAQDVDRDYQIIAKNHADLIARRESANLSQAADDQADRTQFRVIDPPLVPRFPTSPNFVMMFSLVLIGGLATGVALPTGLELIRGTFSTVGQLQEFGLPVIGYVTQLRRPGRAQGFFAQASAVAICMGVLFMAYGALAFFGVGAGGGPL